MAHAATQRRNHLNCLTAEYPCSRLLVLLDAKSVRGLSKDSCKRMAVKVLRAKTGTVSSSSPTTKTKSSSAIATSKKSPAKIAQSSHSAKTMKRKASNKYKDASSREALDSQSDYILHSVAPNSASTSLNEPARTSSSYKNNPFSYGESTEQQRRQTRKQVEATADALNALCDIMS